MGTETEKYPLQIPNTPYHLPSGRTTQQKYSADLICFNTLILELKVTDELTTADRAPLINYLKATGKQTGVLLNFGNKKGLEWKRYIFTTTTCLTRNNIPKTPELKTRQTPATPGGQPRMPDGMRARPQVSRSHTIP
ncbi:MAG: GxxExxY protein [Methanocorpusculum sp.]|uniref:GxxExxY protein n=1 Tax=Methanocorpusculum vombati TaxID=3002864 RepID=A0ABT4IK44_9EURY|nr:GxxExxY protein [Methanocorpusculum vombati]MCZ9319442.1 GxxExxY protein [Methanocorpusculum sp.]MCZ0862124.1 GxxExxY protein [Methanocorpusculum vombati]MDE2534795.1 GxxExxY protein [Methanocorpusculum sp.]MDE2546358.1 GxxExxY protein [Methanocorpusculum sp.]MDE2548596.1 GxxExxY protein [Methanocorpusculum sp.]